MSLDFQSEAKKGHETQTPIIAPRYQELIAHQARDAILPRFTGSQAARGFIDANLPQIVGFGATKNWKGLDSFMASKNVNVIPPDRLDIMNWAQNPQIQKIISSARNLVETRQQIAACALKGDITGAKEGYRKLKSAEFNWAEITGERMKTDREMHRDVREEARRQLSELQKNVPQALERRHEEILLEAAKLAGFSLAGLPGLFGFGEMGSAPAEAAATAQAFALAMYFQETWANIYNKAKDNLGREFILAAEEQKNKARSRPQEESAQERIKRLEAKDADVKNLFDNLNKELGVSPAAVAAGSRFDAKPLEEVAAPRIRKEKKPVDVEVQEPPKSGGGTAMKVPKAGTKGAERETRNKEAEAEARVQPVKQSTVEPKFDADTVGRVAAIKIAMSKLPGIKDPQEYKSALKDIENMIRDAIEAIKAKAQAPKQAKA